MPEVLKIEDVQVRLAETTDGLNKAMAKITELEKVINEDSKLLASNTTILDEAHKRNEELVAEVDKLKGEADLGAQLVAELNAKLDAKAAPAAALASSAKNVAIEKAIRNMVQRLKTLGHLAEINDYEKAKALSV